MDVSGTLLFLLFSAFALVDGAAERSIASKLKICKANNPDLNECFRSAVESAFRTLKNGDRSFGILPLDPMFVPFIELHNGEGPVGLSLKLINTTHYGVSNVKVLSASVNPEKYSFKCKMFLDTYSAIGPYDASGRILILPVVGKGMSNLTMYNTDIDWVFQGKPLKKNGKTYIQITKYELHIAPRGANMHLENLFNGDKLLGDTTNRFLNENSRDVLNELGENLDEALSRLHGGLAQRILDRLPWEDAFPGL